MKQVTIIGAGISGLSLAWWLHKAGANVTVLESDAEVGGTMKSFREGEWLMEQGPNSILATTPLFEVLAKDLGIQSEIYREKPIAKKRYIVRNKQIHALPSSPFSFVSSKLWSTWGKIQLMKEPFISRAKKEESLAEFVTRRLGKEFLDYAINPFVAGVYAGDPALLSVQDAFPKLYALEKNYRSLVLGAIKKRKPKDGSVAKNSASMFSYRNGVQTLPLAIKRALGARVITSCTVNSLRHAEDKTQGYTIEVSENGVATEKYADIVILAVPAYVGTKIIEKVSKEAKKAFAEIPYAPVAEVFLGYQAQEEQKSLDGFGFLVPEKEKLSILGAIWSSALFEGRAPANKQALTVFIGGTRSPKLVEESEATLISLATKDLNTLMGLGSPIYTKVTKWTRAIPQYHLGHNKIIAKLSEVERQNPGLYFSGNYRGGIAVGDCVTSAKALADKILTIEGVV